VRQTRVLDVSQLPTYGFGHRSLLWWGTLGLILIEGTVFAISIASYYYLRGRVPHWPPNVPPPDLLWGTVNTVVLLASLVPNQLYKKAAEQEDLPTLRRWLLIADGFALAFLIFRVFEFKSLNCKWDTNAYGSALWTLLGLHTMHLVTDFIDSIVLTVLMFTGPIEGRRFVDVSENAFYWYFVVLSWLPIYATIYLAVRYL
jgi:heme/copper-type cytochrome/quinol oxidase subunit 3